MEEVMWEADPWPNPDDAVDKLDIMIEAHCDGKRVVIDSSKDGHSVVGSMGGGYDSFDNITYSHTEHSHTCPNKCPGKRINWKGEVSEGESVWVPLTKATAAGISVGIATAPAEGAPVAGQVAHVAVTTAATVGDTNYAGGFPASLAAGSR